MMYYQKQKPSIFGWLPAIYDHLGHIWLFIPTLDKPKNPKRQGEEPLFSPGLLQTRCDRSAFVADFKYKIKQ